MLSPQTTNYPPPYAPLRHELSGSKRGVRIFSRQWRLRRQLTQAYRTPEDPQAIRALEEACRHQTTAPPDSTGDSTIEEALTLLVWTNLRQQSLPAAAFWLDELDRQRPNLPTLGSLRW